MKRYLKIWLFNLFMVFTIAILSCLFGFREGQKRYEVNLFIPNNTGTPQMTERKKSYDACVKLEMRGSPICNCEVIDRGEK